MPRPRTNLEDLRLQGGANVLRTLKRDAQERKTVSMSPERARELAQIDRLIAATLKECERGGTVGKAEKRNPSFAHLSLLLKARRDLLQTPPNSSPPAAKRGEQAQNSFSMFIVPPEEQEK